MPIPEIIAPVNTIEDIHSLKDTKCRNVYAYHSIFQKKADQEKLLEFIRAAKENNINFYINFKNDIKEPDIKKITELFELINTLDFEGIFVNNPGILEIIKNTGFSHQIVIDSGLNVHNLTSVEFVSSICKLSMINITEEIYLKNLVKIRKYNDFKLAVDSNNLPWIAKDILENKIIDAVIIKAKFSTPAELVEGVNSVLKMLETPETSKNQKLPFKNIENSLYKSNHFSREFQNSQGRRFKFSGNVHKFEWDYKKNSVSTNEKYNFDRTYPILNLRLTSIEQMKELKKYLKKLNMNPINAIEYGEILNTADLAKYNFNKIIDKIKKDCYAYGMKFRLGTPKILIERDFDRVYEYTKSALAEFTRTDSIVINNYGFWWNVINDKSINVPIEIGHGFDIQNSSSIVLLENYYHIRTIDFSSFHEIENIKNCIEKIKNSIPVRQITIAGSSRVPSSGLCPLNKDSGVLSRLSCTAPCHNGSFAIMDKVVKKSFPIAVDGFCRMHMFKDKILDLFRYINIFQKIGINEFMIDFSGLPPKFVPILLNRYFESFNNPKYLDEPEFLTEEYGIEKYLSKMSYIY